MNLICVTFNDKDDFNTHKKLYNYGFSNYKNYLIINKKNFKVKNEPNLYIKYNYYYPLRNNEFKNIKTEVIKKRNDNIYGYVYVYFKNKIVHKEPIYINKKYKNNKLLDY